MLLDARWISRPHRRVSTLSGAIILSPDPQNLERLKNAHLPVLANHVSNLGLPNLIVNNNDSFLRISNAITLKTTSVIHEMDAYFSKCVAVHYYNVRADNPKAAYLYAVQYRTADRCAYYKVPVMGSTTTSTLRITPAIILNAAKDRVSPQCFADLRLYTHTWDRLRGVRVDTESLNREIVSCIASIQDHLVKNYHAPRDVHDRFFIEMMKSYPQRDRPHPLDFRTTEALLKTYSSVEQILSCYLGPQIDISPCHSMWNDTYPADSINPTLLYAKYLAALWAIPLTDFKLTGELDPTVTIRNSVLEYAVDRYASVLTDGKLKESRLAMIDVVASAFVRRVIELYGIGDSSDYRGSVIIERSYDEEVCVRVLRDNKQPIVIYFDLLTCIALSPSDCIDTFETQKLYQPLSTDYRDVDNWL